MLSFAAIASGSNGNCYYIGNEQGAVLIDTGISCKETEKRMQRLGLEMAGIKAIFLTHEHSDHIAGLDVISRRYKIPIYATPGTWNGLLKQPQGLLPNFIQRNDTIELNGLTIRSFSKSHDAAEAVSFVVSEKGYNVGVITDIGYACSEVKKILPRCHALFIESNYCVDLLESGSYPRSLKDRISGRKGHLSNQEALELVRHKAGPQLRHLILSHLSANNNRPDLVDSLFAGFRPQMTVHVASRSAESPLWQLDMAGGPRPIGKPNSQNNQLSLFS